MQLGTWFNGRTLACSQRCRFDSCGANAAGSLPDDLSVAEHLRENDNAGRKTGTTHGT